MSNMCLLHKPVLGPLKSCLDQLDRELLKNCSDPSNPQVHSDPSRFYLGPSGFYLDALGFYLGPSGFYLGACGLYLDALGFYSDLLGLRKELRTASSGYIDPGAVLARPEPKNYQFFGPEADRRIRLSELHMGNRSSKIDVLKKI